MKDRNNIASKYALKIDREITENYVKLWFEYAKSFESKGYMIFQFPPKITADSRRMTWAEGAAPGRDPLAVVDTNSARLITLKAEYIVEEYDDNSGSKPNNRRDAWSPIKIKRQINLAKGYFTAWRDQETTQAVFGMRLRHTLITGFGEQGVRMLGCSVDYDGPNIYNKYGGQTYPLKTSITIDLATMSSTTTEPLQLLGTFPPFPKFADYWY